MTECVELPHVEVWAVSQQAVRVFWIAYPWHRRLTFDTSWGRATAPGLVAALPEDERAGIQASAVCARDKGYGFEAPGSAVSLDRLFALTGGAA